MARYPKLYPKVRELCDENHKKHLARAELTSEFCYHCHTMHGWYSFPCSKIKKSYKERYGEALDEVLPKSNPASFSISWNGIINT